MFQKGETSNPICFFRRTKVFHVCCNRLQRERESGAEMAGSCLVQQIRVLLPSHKPGTSDCVVRFAEVCPRTGVFVHVR